jgi:hypothetical protein
VYRNRLQAVKLVNEKYAQGFSLDLGGGGNNRMTPHRSWLAEKKGTSVSGQRAIAAGFYVTAITSNGR